MRKRSCLIARIAEFGVAAAPAAGMAPAAGSGQIPAAGIGQVAAAGFGQVTPTGFGKTAAPASEFRYAATARRPSGFRECTAAAAAGFGKTAGARIREPAAALIEFSSLRRLGLVRELRR